MFDAGYQCAIVRLTSNQVERARSIATELTGVASTRFGRPKA